MELRRDPDDEEQNENEPARDEAPQEEATTAIISQQITTHCRVEEVTDELMNELGRISLVFLASSRTFVKQLKELLYNHNNNFIIFKISN